LGLQNLSFTCNLYNIIYLPFYLLQKPEVNLRSISIVFCVFVVLLSVHITQAAIIHVPADSSTIQAGINGAVNGDTVMLADGIYTGVGNRYIDYYGKAIRVISESGNPDNCIIDCQKAGCGFLFHSGEGHGSVLEGVTIKNGQFDWGGGIDCWDYSSPTLVNVSFLENTATWGGGIRCWNSSPILINVTFSKNSANAGGGYYGQNSSPTLINVTFSENTAIWGGGMYCDSNPILTKVTFSNNHAEWGGGLFSDGISASLTNCIFSSNHGSSGGAIESWNSSLTLSECVFSENTAQEGGAMLCWDSSHLHLNKCTFYGNSTTSSWGGIFSGDNSSVFLVNSIVAFTRAGGTVGCDGLSSATLSYCDVYGNVGGDWVACIAGQDTIAGNISCNPKFCYPDTGDFYLGGNSCCVGAGCDSLGNPDSSIDIGAFGVGCPPLLPGPFSLLFPLNKAFTPRKIHLDWETASYPDTFDQVKYDLYVSTSYNFSTDSTIINNNLTISEHIKTLDYGTYYWKVKAKDSGGGENWSNQTCYFTVTGMHYSIIGDFNGDGAIIVGDVVFSINYLFRSGPSPDPLEVGDCNCDGKVDVSDIVYLINYLFNSGPPPSC